MSYECRLLYEVQKLFLVSANKKEVDRLIVNSIMPQKKSVKHGVKTLSQLCVDNVIEGLERGLKQKWKDDVKA